MQRALNEVTAPDQKRMVAIRLAGLDITHGDPEVGIGVLREIAAANPQDVDVRALMLGLPRIDQDAATRLLDEIKQIEGDSGVWWRFHQARLWLADPDWRTRQQEIEELLLKCIDADPRWTPPILLLGGVYERLGNWTDAERVYRLSDATEAADRLLALLSRQKRFAERGTC